MKAPFDIRDELAVIFSMAPRPRAEYTLLLVVDAVLAEERALPEISAYGSMHVTHMAARRDGERSQALTLSDPDARLQADAYRKWHARVIEMLVTDGVKLLAELVRYPAEAVSFEALASRLDAALQAFERLDLPWWQPFTEIDERPLSVVEYARRRLSELETAQIRRAS